MTINGNANEFSVGLVCGLLGGGIFSGVGALAATIVWLSIKAGAIGGLGVGIYSVSDSVYKDKDDNPAITPSSASGMFTGMVGVGYLVAHMGSTEPTTAPAVPTVAPAPYTAPACDLQKTRFSNHDKAIQKVASKHGLTMPKALALV